jgi:hypothetical protein
MQKLILYFGLQAMLLAPPTHAYIGPGAGAGTIAIVFGVIASIFLAFVAILWYPFKRYIKGRKKSANKTNNEPSDAE